MEVSMTINGTIKITLTPKTETMKYLSELIKDSETYMVSKPNNSTEIVFTQIKEQKTS